MLLLFFSSFNQNKASLCLLGNTCIRLGMLGGKGHTPVSNWNAIMYELTWLQGWGGWRRGWGVIERWIPACDVRLLPYSTVDIPEVIEHEWVRRLHTDGSMTKSSVYVYSSQFFPVPKVESLVSVKYWGVILLILEIEVTSPSDQWPRPDLGPELPTIQSKSNGLG